jgi:hypothetical protein
MTNDHRDAPPLRRSLILVNVLDAEDEEAYQREDSLDNLSSTQNLTTNFEHGQDYTESSSFLHPEVSLEEVRTWLDAQCEQEQARADWSSERRGNRINLIEKNGNLKRGLDTDVLSRVRKGYGTRSAKFEDLLWPLRMDEDAPRFFKKPIKQTRQEMESVVRGWNRHVGAPIEDAEAREALIDAKYARVEYLDGSLSYRRSADAHDITTRKLLHAIHAYRLETVHFSTKDTCDLITIILAHLGYAIPDVDEELKYLMFYTLVTERQYLAHTANATTARKLEKQIMDAKRCGDADTAQRHERQIQRWSMTIWQNNCDVIAERVKIARRNVELKFLEELQELTILQTAQKIVLRERISRGAPPSGRLIPRSTWLPEHADTCNTALTTLNQTADEHLSDFLASLKTASENIAGMRDIAHVRILNRAIKFAGLDLPSTVVEPERDRIVKARMGHPGTMNMILDAIKAVKETEVKSKEMVDAMGKINNKFEDVLRAAEEVEQEFEGFLKLLDADTMLKPGFDLDGTAEWEDLS